MKTQLPILYSFRRCPYAIRARLALYYAGIKVELREVLLKDKPEAMLAASAKGTVPVLILDDGSVLDESLDVMGWALQQNDVDSWWPTNVSQREKISQLIEFNDFQFKPWLDRYKYHERYPEQDKDFYFRKACEFLNSLEKNLQEKSFLVMSTPCLADVAIFPFIRQFANADKKYFDQLPYPELKNWLTYFLQWPSFECVMKKYYQWNENDLPVCFP